MDAPPKLTENGLCRSNSLAHYDAGFTERPSHHPYNKIESIGGIKALSTDVNFQNDLQYSINPRLISWIPSNPKNSSRIDLYSNVRYVPTAAVQIYFLNGRYVEG